MIIESVCLVGAARLYRMPRMMNTFENPRVTVAFLFGESLPYDIAAFGESVQAALEQDHERVDVVVVEGRGGGAGADCLPAGVDARRVRHIAGSFANRAAMCNAALKVAGDYLLVVYCDRAQVVLRRSAVRTMVMAAVRNDRSETGATGLGFMGIMSGCCRMGGGRRCICWIGTPGGCATRLILAVRFCFRQRRCGRWVVLMSATTRRISTTSG